MDQSPQKRRSFPPRFSLRTLLILLTVAGIFVAYQARWIKERREYIKSRFTVPEFTDPADKTVAAPMLMGIWGEPGQCRLFVEVTGYHKNYEYHESNPGPEAEEVRRLFPEAIIEVMEGNVLCNTWLPGEKWNQ